jgi:HPt (histidine-containing phosphotransfer) domain-containing protein
MNDHLAKPIDAAALLAMIERWARPHPVVEAASEPKVQDPDILIDLERHIGLDQVSRMVALAHDDIPRRLIRMEKGLADLPLIEREAHELIAISGNLGFTELAAASRRLTVACREGEGEEIARIWENVKAAGERAMDVIRDLHRSSAAAE